MSFEYVPHDRVDLDGAMLLAALPAVGMEGAVAAGFIVDELKMRMLGEFHSQELPPVASFRDGLATSPVQAWHAEIACGIAGANDRLVIIKSDVPVPSELLAPLAAGIIRWARDQGIELVIGFDTYARHNVEGHAGVLVAASREGAAAREQVKGTPLDKALATGFTPALLLNANRHGVAAVGLFAPSTKPEAEIAGTTALIEAARPLMPPLNLDTADLVKLVEQKSADLERERAQQAEEARRMHEMTNRGYL